MLKFHQRLIVLATLAISTHLMAITNSTEKPVYAPPYTFQTDMSTEDISVYDGLDMNQAYHHFVDVHKNGKMPASIRARYIQAKKLDNNLIKIREFNAESKAEGDDSMMLGVTSHADMSEDEYRQEILKTIIPADTLKLAPSIFDEYLETVQFNLPDSKDWRDENVIGPVKNQWFCGSCYIFSAVGVIESAWAILNHHTGGISLSEQQALDCNGKDGCEGGWPTDIFKYAQTNGLCRHGSYPNDYTFKRDCRTNKVQNCGDKVFVDQYFSVPQTEDDSSMLEALQHTTLSIAMDASSWHFQLYMRGIYRSKHCPKNPSLNHALEIVGYGQDGDDKYWIVKNSWGHLWGDFGYIKVDRNTANTCGISQAVTYPTIK